jgi:pyruvate dehydrogenase E2 component (dihydrolipoamide acetyltransferase)
MAREVVLVKAGLTMTEGTIAEWYVPDGGEVTVGQLIYRMETEKINLEVESEEAGILRHVVPAGTTTEPGALVAYVLEPGEAMPAGVPAVAGAAPAVAQAPSQVDAAPGVPPQGGGDERVAASPAARRLAREAGISLVSIRGTGPGGRITETDVEQAKAAAASAPPAPPPAVSPASGVQPAPSARAASPATPLAKKLAEALRLDLANVKGTGPGGHITRADVEAAVAPAASAGRTAGARHSAGEHIPVRGIRKVIAERMHGSLRDMAQLTMAMDADVTEAVALRARLVREWEPEGVRPSYTDLVVKAVAGALREHPLLNASWRETEIVLHEEVHIGLAVALDDGLVVPVIRNVDRLSVREISAEAARLAGAARGGTLGLDDMAGQTFSITTLGMANIDVFTPVINPPDVAILGVGRIRDGFAWEGDRPVRRSFMTLSLTIDHRAVDGTPGAAFLNAVRERLETPYRLLG